MAAFGTLLTLKVATLNDDSLLYMKVVISVTPLYKG